MHIYIKSTAYLILMWASSSYAGKSIEYYSNNIEKANDVNASCIAEIKEAVYKGDEDRMDYIYDNDDCRNAKKAIDYVSSKKRSEKYTSDEEYHIAIYKNLNISSYMNEEIDCLRSNSKSPKCSAFYKLLPLRKDEYLAYIESKDKAELVLYSNDACNKNSSSSTACVYVTSLQEKRELESIKLSILNISYAEYFEKQSSCDNPKSLRCDYLKSILNDKKDAYIKSRIENENHRKLFQEKERICDNGNRTLCKLHRKINQKLIDHTITIYISDKKKLEEDRSACVNKMEDYKKDKNSEKRREVRNSLECKAAFRASRKVSK